MRLLKIQVITQSAALEKEGMRKNQCNKTENGREFLSGFKRNEKKEQITLKEEFVFPSFVNAHTV